MCSSDLPRAGLRLEPASELKLAEAVDPVCGMTVMANASARPATREGVTYYFCCAGCQQKFNENPAAYIGVLR